MMANRLAGKIHPPVFKLVTKHNQCNQSLLTVDEILRVYSTAEISCSRRTINQLYFFICIKLCLIRITRLENLSKFARIFTPLVEDKEEISDF